MKPRVLDPDSIRAYAARDWGALREAKRQFWRKRLDDGGLRAALQITSELRAWMAGVNPDWPSEKDREEDLETHRRVAQALAKVTPQASRPGGVRARRVR